MISFHLSFDWLKRKLLSFFRWLKLLFITRYAVTVSFNKEWGDADDKSYIAKKIIVQKRLCKIENPRTYKYGLKINYLH